MASSGDNYQDLLSKGVLSALRVTISSDSDQYCQLVISDGENFTANCYLSYRMRYLIEMNILKLHCIFAVRSCSLRISQKIPNFPRMYLIIHRVQLLFDGGVLDVFGEPRMLTRFGSVSLSMYREDIKRMRQEAEKLKKTGYVSTEYTAHVFKATMLEIYIPYQEYCEEDNALTFDQDVGNNIGNNDIKNFDAESLDYYQFYSALGCPPSQPKPWRTPEKY